MTRDSSYGLAGRPVKFSIAQASLSRGIMYGIMYDVLQAGAHHVLLSYQQDSRTNLKVTRRFGAFTLLSGNCADFQIWEKLTCSRF